MKILVTGATGYIGSRLVPRLLTRGHEVRCLSRRPERLTAPWRTEVEVVQGDVLDQPRVEAAMEGCDAAFYLVHSMGAGGGDFDRLDHDAAVRFRTAAATSTVRRIVYLGGLGRGDDLSKHLSSRQEVGATLAAGPTPVTELRAAVIVGAGSVSFEMLRHLTEVLPLMITPRWVRTRCQPIAIADVLELLVAAVEDERDGSEVHEIGGPDQLTYEEMMRVYAQVVGLRRRWILPVPVLSPRLSSHWVGLVTPLPAAIAKPLVESLRVEVTVTDNAYAERLGPLTPYRDAVRAATGDLAAPRPVAPAAWGEDPAVPSPTDPPWAGSATRVDVQVVAAACPPDDVAWAFSRLGGTVGYYALDWAWWLRGWLDATTGGVGLRRGRRHPELLRAGDSLDFWRVVRADPGRGLWLRAEMRLPGQAWLSFETQPAGTGALLRQTAVFVPSGLLGRLYWWILVPVHTAIFRRMARGIVAAAEQRYRRPSQAPGRRGAASTGRPRRPRIGACHFASWAGVGERRRRRPRRTDSSG